MNSLWPDCVTGLGMCAFGNYIAIDINAPSKPAQPPHNQGLCPPVPPPGRQDIGGRIYEIGNQGETENSYAIQGM